jgi:perosamine synthetase
MRPNELSAAFAPDPFSEETISTVTSMLREGELYRYGNPARTDSHASLFEQEFAASLKKKYALAVNSGGSAILLSLAAAGIMPGDQVLVPSFTFTAVTSAIVLAGARPVFIDIDEDYCQSIADLERKAHSRPRALLLSYMRGHASNLGAIVDVCSKTNILLIEDCAHGLGTTWQQRPLGDFGIAATFSFQDKMLNCGEGGLIATDDEELHMRTTVLSGCYESLWKTHGLHPAMENPWQGRLAQYSMRMSELPAALLRPQLPLVEQRVKHYQSLLEALQARLRESPHIQIPPQDVRTSFVSDTCQFRTDGFDEDAIERLVHKARGLGIPLSAFGDRSARNERCFWNWHYVAESTDTLPNAQRLLKKSYDLKLRLSMTTEVAATIGATLAGLAEEISQGTSS